MPARCRLVAFVRDGGHGRTGKKAGVSTVWLSLSPSRFLGCGSALWHLNVGIWLMVSFFQLYWVSNAYLPSQSWALLLIDSTPLCFAPMWFTLKLKSWLLAHFIAPLMVTNA